MRALFAVAFIAGGIALAIFGVVCLHEMSDDSAAGVGGALNGLGHVLAWGSLGLGGLMAFVGWLVWPSGLEERASAGAVRLPAAIAAPVERHAATVPSESSNR